MHKLESPLQKYSYTNGNHTNGNHDIKGQLKMVNG